MAKKVKLKLKNIVVLLLLLVRLWDLHCLTGFFGIDRILDMGCICLL